MRALALFDFDGTLCKSDSFTDFIHYVFDKSYFLKQGLKVLPQVIAYYSNIYPAHRMRAKLYKKMFQDYPLAQAEHLAKQYAQYVYQHKLNPAVLARLHWHQQQQHRVIIVSASLDLYLIPVAQSLAVELICTQVDRSAERLSGYYASPDCSRSQKVLRLQQYLNLQDYSEIYAYGNSHEDYAMLELAEHAYWVDKKQRLTLFDKLILSQD